MIRQYPNPFRQYENSIFTNSRGYDPIRQPDLIRIRVKDGAVIADRLDPVARGRSNGYEIVRGGRKEVMVA